MRKLKTNSVKKHFGTSLFIGLLCASFNINAQDFNVGSVLLGTGNVGVGAIAPPTVIGTATNTRMHVDGGVRNGKGAQIAQSFRSASNFSLTSSRTSGSFGHNNIWAGNADIFGVNATADVSTLSANNSKTRLFGGRFVTQIDNVSGSYEHNIGGVSGFLTGALEAEITNGYAAAVVGVDEINNGSTLAGYFVGNIVAGNVRNPQINIENDLGNTLQFGVSSCDGCYNGFAKSGDAVIRTLGGRDLIFSILPNNINTERKISFNTESDQIMTVQQVGASGVVGVGTTSFPTTVGTADVSAYKLFVKGGILTEEVRVRTGWADYVFDKSYQLKGLNEVEDFINENGHLPNVPSAKEVESSGIAMGEITKIQQEKIEELTLYLIEQQKQIDELKKVVQGLIKNK